MSRELFLLWVTQSFVMSHSSSAQQLEIGDELSRRAESVSQDLRFCVVVDGGVSVKDGVDNSWVSKEKLRGCVQVLQELSPISGKITVAASFSKVHDVCRFLANFQSLRPKRWAMKFRFPSFATQRREDERGHWRPVGALGGVQEPW